MIWPTQKALVPVDLGAESCRVSLLRWHDGKPHITLVHRFSNAPVKQGGELHWSLATIQAGVDDGLRQCVALAPEDIGAIAVDGWAVDYVRLDHEGKPLADPFCYRDLRTVAAEEKLHARITPERLRAITPMRINTLYQQVADRTANLPASGGWLNLPEYLLFSAGRPRGKRAVDGGALADDRRGHANLVSGDLQGGGPECVGRAVPGGARHRRWGSCGRTAGRRTADRGRVPRHRIGYCGHSGAWGTTGLTSARARGRWWAR